MNLLRWFHDNKILFSTIIELRSMKVWLYLSFIVTFEVGGSIDCSRKPAVEGES